MKDVLIVTLGTSPEPIINCISSLRPERVVFLCSTESAMLVEKVLAKVPIADFQVERDVEILQQRKSSSDGHEVINELDRLDCVYTHSLDLFSAIRKAQPGCRITVDYAGGTKTMTTGLAMAAIDDGDIRINLTTSDRIQEPSLASRFNYKQANELLETLLKTKGFPPADGRTIKELKALLHEVESQANKLGKSTITGYSAPVAVSTAAIHARRLRERELPALLKRHDYEAARQAVRRVQAYADPDPETQRWLLRLEALLVALDAWDRFDHFRAHQVLAGLQERELNASLLLPLKRVIGSRRLLDGKAEEAKWPQMKGHGLEAVEDLLRNAERRAIQERFDDAVGRLYRAMELTAQLLLKIAVTEQVGHEGIATAAVDLDRLPAAIQPRWREKAADRSGIQDGEALKIGLADAYDLLADLGHPTGQRWRDQRATLLDALQTRNHSLFAHGFQPVAYGSWQKLWTTLGTFLEAAIAQQREAMKRADPELQQFPTSLEGLHLEE